MASRISKQAAHDKRLRILDAARAVCARSGYDAALMQEIAAEARVSKGTLYNFFESKEDLFLATVLDSYADAARQIDAQSEATLDPAARLEGLLEFLAKLLAKVSSEMTVNFQVWGVIARDEEARRRMVKALGVIYAERSAEIRKTLQEGAAQGRFRADLDCEAVTTGLLAIFDGFVYRSTFDPANANPDRLRRCFDVLIRENVACEDPSAAASGGMR